MSKITSLRTLRLPERPKLIWLEIETDEGLIGLGETFRGAATVEAAIHELIAPGMIGRDSRQIEAISRELTTPYVGFHSASAEIRAASAVDIALWDIKGQRHGIPIHEALGGACRDRIRVYNTCAGYEFNTQQGARREITAADCAQGPYDDQLAFSRDAGALAVSLVEEGYTAMKIWPFDRFATQAGANSIGLAEVQQGCEAFRQIRQAVGNRIEIMCELHSLWDSAAALRICQALEEFDVYWVEDPLCKMDDAHALADLRNRTRVPICASETLGGSVAYRDLLNAGSMDFLMLDLVWCGGFTEARKIAAMAQIYNKPLAPHDCTGPVALFAGLHLGVHAPTAVLQEVVRASLSTWYGELVTHLPGIAAGFAAAPRLPGLGTALRPEVRRRADAIVRETR
ncbi:Mandelate racemase/muconate lactonizing protein [Pseudomonas syringae pv. aceris]|uniref:Mandelate racemase/muconate lactonizing protein n=2 Tax=Pseudomonas syringae TaxID=317 RepID=A0A0L8ISL6_PSESX|nr:mandelate racemase/muconate lactonizing enzyme family protein [Pseudomonas syringae]KOG04411.1 Mandelate racemase/muconate lactonizing protein [Pseudomonas syringae pv. aceris]KPW15214.1 Mandelate racemase/muconate lactonizing protein [Pseudomonas syringae pv. aceris]